MTAMTANPERVQMQTTPPVHYITTEYVVVNDPAVIDAFIRNDGSPIPEALKELLKEPLFVNELPGPAKRFQLWTNELEPTRELGPVILCTRTVSRTPYRTITGAEWDAIDEGRRANG